MANITPALAAVALCLAAVSAARAEIRSIAINATEICTPTALGTNAGWKTWSTPYRWNVSIRGVRARVNGQNLDCNGQPIKGRGLATSGDVRQFGRMLAAAVDDPFIESTVTCRVQPASASFHWHGEAGGRFKPKDQSFFFDNGLYVYDLRARFSSTGAGKCSMAVETVWGGRLKKGQFTILQGELARCTYKNVRCAMR